MYSSVCFWLNGETWGTFNTPLHTHTHAHAHKKRVTSTAQRSIWDTLLCPYKNTSVSDFFCLLSSFHTSATRSAMSTQSSTFSAHDCKHGKRKQNSDWMNEHQWRRSRSLALPSQTQMYIVQVQKDGELWLVRVRLVVCHIFPPSHSNNLWLSDWLIWHSDHLERRKNIMLTDPDIRRLHCQISAHFSGCSHTEARPLRVFLCRPLQYLPSVRRAYSILCLFVTVHLAVGVQGHNSPPLLPTPR